MVLDAGNIASDPELGRVVWETMRAAGYDAVAPGPDEMAWAKEYAAMAREGGVRLLGLPAQPGFDPPAAGAGLRTPTAGGREFFIKTLGQRRVGVASLGSEVSPSPERVQHVAGVLRELRGTCDVVVLLSHRSLQEEELALGGTFKGLVDLVIGPAGSDTLKEPRPVGSSYILPAALQGREVGVVSIPREPRLAGSERCQVEFRRLVLNGDSPVDASVLARVQAYHTAQQERILARAQPDVLVPGYATAQDCRECHAAAYDVWSKSAHARALKTLVDRKSAVPECLACHSEAFRRTGKANAEAPVQGVECTSCHGAATAVHLAVPRAGNIERASLAQCGVCHTAEHSPAFDGAAGWVRVQHR